MRFKREHFNLYLNYLNTVSLDKIDKMIEIVDQWNSVFKSPNNNFLDKIKKY